jgi:uncharacterized protein
MSDAYLEIVTNDADVIVQLYGQALGVAFSEPDPDLGFARVAQRGDGSLIGVRPPLASHEEPIVRTYLRVDDIEAAVAAAENAGALVAYGPTEQGARGTFAIVIAGGVQLGFWQHS